MAHVLYYKSSEVIQYQNMKNRLQQKTITYGISDVETYCNAPKDGMFHLYTNKICELINVNIRFEEQFQPAHE